MKQTCIYSMFDSNAWVFLCSLTGERCTSGKHFPNLENCPRKFDDIFAYTHIKENFDRLFPAYSKRTRSWKPEPSMRAECIHILLDNEVVLIFEYRSDFDFKFYTDERRNKNEH